MIYIFILILFLIDILHAIELKYLSNNGGRYQFFKDIEDLKIYTKPWEVVKITMVNTNPKGYSSITTEDLIQLEIIQRFKNLKAFELNFSYNDIEDISPLRQVFNSSFSKLQTLIVNVNHGMVTNYESLQQASISKTVTYLNFQTERCHLVTNPQNYYISFTSDGLCSTKEKNAIFLGL